MKKADITKYLSKAGFQLKKHSPEILAAFGVIGVIASAVMACKATTKISPILEKAQDDIDMIHDCDANETMEEYTHEDAQNDLMIVYAKTGVKLAKLYGPAIALGALSLGGILTSNNILRKRNAALAAAYVAVDKGFKEYRNRVAERFGKAIDRELKYNIKAKQISETVVDENGDEKEIEKTVEVADALDGYSDYARFFDDGCPGWEKDPGQNLMFLRAQQQYANDKLKANGRLFLNDVYDLIGIPRSKAGQVVGWIYDHDKPVGDNYIDFGIYDIRRPKNRDFVNGYEKTILLDFNVDGNVWDSMI
jgi:hypothetical protein